VKSLLALIVFASALFLSPAFAQSQASQSTQQSKMSQCNKDAAGMKGDQRKAFMKDCLSAKPAAAGNSQQTKMATCNKDATGMKGDERKKFMSECLKK
jgi:hypothetical protein